MSRGFSLAYDRGELSPAEYEALAQAAADSINSEA
jgi:hypothetical protein